VVVHIEAHATGGGLDRYDLKWMKPQGDKLE
jgi:hypothetical protein